jgi:hypothetical protein
VKQVARRLVPPSRPVKLLISRRFAHPQFRGSQRKRTIARSKEVAGWDVHSNRIDFSTLSTGIKVIHIVSLLTLVYLQDNVSHER